MRFELQLQDATPVQRTFHDIAGSDVALMVGIDGRTVAWMDDYGTAHILDDRYRKHQEGIERIVAQISESDMLSVRETPNRFLDRPSEMKHPDEDTA